MTTTTETQNVIEPILEKLLSSYDPQKVILFGSHAYGNPQPDSDIDLLIIKETSERFIDRWTTVRRILSDSKRMVPLETLVLTPQEVSRVNAFILHPRKMTANACFSRQDLQD